MLEKKDYQNLPLVGMGYDAHRYGVGRPLVLGGVAIPCELEVIAHSDGDVLLHALMDALLGCAALGDIGSHFPDHDARYTGIASGLLLKSVLEMVYSQGLKPYHADLTVVAQRPKLAPYKEAVRSNISKLLDVESSHINIKATTEEGMGFTGRLEGIKAIAIVSCIGIQHE